MKKVYRKPQIMFEDFTLSTNIAGGCEVIVNNSSSGKCAYEGYDEFYGDVNIFVLGVSVCEFTQPEGYDGVCYHTFEGNSIFNS